MEMNSLLFNVAYKPMGFFCTSSVYFRVPFVISLNGLIQSGAVFSF